MAEDQEPREQPEPAGAAADEPAGELAEEQLDEVAGGNLGATTLPISPNQGSTGGGTS